MQMDQGLLNILTSRLSGWGPITPQPKLSAVGVSQGHVLSPILKFVNDKTVMGLIQDDGYQVQTPTGVLLITWHQTPAKQKNL